VCTIATGAWWLALLARRRQRVVGRRQERHVTSHVCFDLREQAPAMPLDYSTHAMRV
jgi:hypothetical protein